MITSQLTHQALPQTSDEANAHIEKQLRAAGLL